MAEPEHLTLDQKLEELQRIKDALGIVGKRDSLIKGDFALPVFRPLMKKATYKAAHGGRASAKSWFFADLHLHTALTRPGYRALCLRQTQKSINESLKFLIEARISFWGLQNEFDIQASKIYGPGGGEFVFHGLDDQSSESIKSFEGFDVADIEEGQVITQRSLDLLVPTIIRKDGAQIWARWNPRHDTDPIDIMFREKTPSSAIVVACSYKDNPHLNEQTLQQIKEDFANDPEKAEHIWGGGYEEISEAHYYSKEIAEMKKERYGDFPYDTQQPVVTSWDIGVDDYTAIWFFQLYRQRVHVIDYFETSGDGVDTLYDVCHVDKNYRYEAHYMPHDVMVREWGGGAKTRRQSMLEKGFSNVIAGARLGPDDRINASRELLKICYFDNNPRVALGVRRLRSYKRKFNRTMGVYGGPAKDGNDHGADAFGEFALNCPVLPKRVYAGDTRTAVERMAAEYGVMVEDTHEGSFL